MIALTKADLRDLGTPALTSDDLAAMVTATERLAMLHARSPEEALMLSALVARGRGAVFKAEDVDERGTIVLEWRIPAEWALTVNEINGLNPRYRQSTIRRIKESLVDSLRGELRSWPDADLKCAHRRRWVDVRRFTSGKLDEPDSADGIGGKHAIDILTKAGVLHQDNKQWIVRKGAVIPCKPGATHLVIRILEIRVVRRLVMVVPESTVPEPECLPPPKPVKKVGPLKRSIIDAKAVSP